MFGIYPYLSLVIIKFIYDRIIFPQQIIIHTSIFLNITPNTVMFIFIFIERTNNFGKEEKKKVV